MIGTLIRLFRESLTSPQKTAEKVQEIPQDDHIYIRSFSERPGYIKTALYYSWWVNTPDFVKEWESWALEEYMTEAYDIKESTMSFFASWDGLSDTLKKMLLHEFVQAHEPMIRKELDEHYQKMLQYR